MSRRYPGLTALDGIDLEVAAGEVVMLTGASGAGKSTVLHVTGGMDQPDEGHVEIDGTELVPRNLDRHRRRIGFVFQRFHLLPALTALDNVLAPSCPAEWTSTGASAAWNCSKRSAWETGPTPCPRSCRAVSSNASPSPARWSTGRDCCWPTSRPATWTASSGGRSSIC